jgi:hypothetical protein
LPVANRGSEKTMTDKKSFADRARDHATDDGSPHAHQAPERCRWTDLMKHFCPRWSCLRY